MHNFCVTSAKHSFTSRMSECLPGAYKKNPLDHFWLLNSPMVAFWLRSIKQEYNCETKKQFVLAIWAYGGMYTHRSVIRSMHLHIKIHNSIYLIHYSCVLTEFSFSISTACYYGLSHFKANMLGNTQKNKRLNWYNFFYTQNEAKWFTNRKLKSDENRLYLKISCGFHLTINRTSVRKTYKHEKVKEWNRNLNVTSLRVGVCDYDTVEWKEV